MKVPQCTIRGHNHEVVLHQTHTQQGTGDKAYTWACPGGRYRWFQIATHNEEGRPLSPYTKRSEPRWGWKD